MAPLMQISSGGCDKCRVTRRPTKGIRAHTWRTRAGGASVQDVAHSPMKDREIVVQRCIRSWQHVKVEDSLENAKGETE